MAAAPAESAGTICLDYFKHEKDTGQPKGIVLPPMPRSSEPSRTKPGGHHEDTP